MKTIRYLDRHIKEVENVKPHKTTRIDDEATQLRFKRSVFIFIGGSSKLLFGTMDSEDASYYKNKISDLEKEHADFLKLSKEQITVVKST
jgi:hypothetical protein